MLSFQFDNRFASELPGDPERGPQRRQVHGALWSHAACTPVAAPRTLAVAAPVAKLLDIDSRDLDSEQFAAVFAGNQVLPGMQPIASNYGGHQFGQWAGQLGDGRAISLGETINSRGERWELQLKGAGPTPYSRGADGRAVLRSSLREFVCSEAMVALGVPSTRALSLVASGDTVVRDMFYDGNPQAEQGAIVCRVAPSFIRLGHFELPASRGEHTLLNQLIDFTIDRDFPHISGSNARADWFVEVCERTALLMAHWMRVGFVHGVMNTDNLSILGLSVDYGPYGWLEDFDPNWTPNTTDAQGRRYRYGAQPEIAHWNLGAFASALASVFEDQAPLHAGMQAYAETFTREHARMNAQKLGLSEWREEDLSLTRGLYQWMQAAEVDMPLFFRRLAEVDPASASLGDFSAALYSQSKAEAEAQSLHHWLAAYRQRLESDPAPPTQRAARMNAANPLYVPRNWLCQQAIDEASKGELGELQALMKVLADPYRQQPNAERFALKRPEWARVKAGCSMLSCSS